MFRFVNVAILLLSIALPVQADTNWLLPAGQSGDWSQAANWSDGLPTLSTNASIVSGGTVTITATGATCATLHLSGTVQMSGGSISPSGDEYLGYSGSSMFNQSGGVNQISSMQHELIVGFSSTAIYNLSGNGQVSVNSSAAGLYTTGIINQTGGTYTALELGLGIHAGGIGMYNLGAGVLSVSDCETVGVHVGTGTLTLTGGTNNCSTLVVGYGFDYSAAPTGSYDLKSGSLNSSYEFCGYSGAGTITQTGGTNHAAFLQLGLYPSGRGRFDLNGGVLTVGSLSAGSGSAIFNFGGGTLKTDGSLSTSLPMTLTGTSGNANIDTTNGDVTMAGALTGTGGLNKLGVGMLTLSGQNAYAGDTMVGAGVLRLMQPDLFDGSSISVAPHATLNLTFSGTDTVRYLNLGGLMKAPGLYDAANSDGYITGSGAIFVTAPEPSALVLLGVGALGLLGFAWRRREPSR